MSQAAYQGRAEPVPPPPTAQDEQYLDTLGILHYVYGALMALGGVMFGLFALLPALIMSAAPASSSTGGPPPWVVGTMFGVIFGLAALFLIGKAIVIMFAGRALRERKSYILCMVAACLAVMNIPLGTGLAIFTFVLLTKPSVKYRFEHPPERSY